MRKYQEPPFREPLGSSFVYAAWSIDPVRVGPFVRSSAVRRQRIDKIRGVPASWRSVPTSRGCACLKHRSFRRCPGCPSMTR